MNFFCIKQRKKKNETETHVYQWLLYATVPFYNKQILVIIIIIIIIHFKQKWNWSRWRIGRILCSLGLM